MIDIKEIAKYYNSYDFVVMKEINSSRDDSDKRYTYLLKFDNDQELALKVCRNNFTSPKRVAGWAKICKHYLDLGIYCPQIVNSLNNRESETVVFNNETFIVYAEEIKKYKTVDEFNPGPDYSSLKETLIESVGLVASKNQELVPLVPWASPYCIFTKFSEDDTTDENYESAEFFCTTIKTNFPQHSEYINKIWDTYLLKRKYFEPVYYKLPKSVFQADLNGSNVLLNDDKKFVGLIDFNLAGTESILCYILMQEVCLFQLDTDDLEQLNNKDFLKKCDDYLYNNLKIINKHYHFTNYEKENFNLCYNTIIPFCSLMITGMLRYAMRENKEQHIEKILDWVYYQLCRNDLSLNLLNTR